MIADNKKISCSIYLTSDLESEILSICGAVVRCREWFLLCSFAQHVSTKCHTQMLRICRLAWRSLALYKTQSINSETCIRISARNSPVTICACLVHRISGWSDQNNGYSSGRHTKCNERPMFRTDIHIDTRALSFRLRDSSRRVGLNAGAC